MSKNPWKEYKKGVKYLRKNGLLLILQLPPGGKFQYISCQPGFAMEDVKKETLPRPYKVKTSDGKKTIQISTKFMDRFELITEMDLRRLIRNSSIILTNFTGPIGQDNFKIHLERLQRWIATDVKNRQQEFVGSLLMIDSLLGFKEPLPLEEYYEAGTILGNIYKLW